ncbi:recombinase family protein [[Clostridium] colinum]|uniref:recombinase family protein n=1 Tax=[Clostridium] colinum TaxID=36835 RepID=UPI002024BD13|nr:recombinase family protein [[Clostridium] colinum]
MKIGVYTRLSKEDKNKNESESIINQKNLIENFIKNNNELKNCEYFFYTDDGYVGSNFERPEFKKLIEDIKKNKINCIIVKDLSRLGRDYIKVNEYLDKIFPFFNIRFISINDNYDSKNNKNTTNDLDICFKNIIHSYYVKDLSKKVKSGMISKVKQGNYIWTYAPFGYKKNNETKTLEIDNETAPIVKIIFELLSKGYKYNEICKFLNNNNIPTRKYFKIKNNEINNINQTENKMWKVQDLKNIKTNEVYIGNSISFKRKRIKCGNNKTTKSNKNEIIRIENTHPPIISKEVFEKVNSYKRKSTNNIVKNIFAYKLKCGHCGYSLRYYKVLKNGNVVDRKYYCYSKNENQNSICYKGEICETNIKEIILESINTLILAYFKKNNLYNKNINLDQNLDFYYKQLEKYNKLKMSYYEKYLEGEIEKNNYINIKLDIEDKINNLKISSNISTAKNDKVLNKSLFLEQLDKKIVDVFINNIYIYNENNIKINWKFKLK